jgi:hypothetical protein
MRRIAATLLAASLLAGTAATAQQVVPMGAPLEPRYKAGRLLIGIAGVTDGFYCSYGYVLASCSSMWSYDYAPLAFGAEFETGGRALGIVLGVHDLNGPYNNVNRNFVEPLADLVFRFGTYSGGPMIRVRLGMGAYFGPSWNLGVVGRGGFGLSLRGREALGFAMEASWEGGSFDGHPISVAKFQIGPEIAF